MKKILVILLCCPIFVFGQLGDYYKSNGHTKAKGLNFQIKIPLGFEQKEADRPNIVQKWTKGNTSFMVMVKNLDQEIKNISKNDWKDYLKNGSGLTDFTSGLSNISNLKEKNKKANITLKFWNEIDKKCIERKITINNNGSYWFYLKDDKKILNFLKSKSGWVTIQSDNPFVNGWYFELSNSGIVGADHLF